MKEVKAMKNTKRIAKLSEKIDQQNTSTWMPIFYDPLKKEVYATETSDRYLMTYLTRPNTPEEIERAVERFRNL